MVRCTTLARHQHSCFLTLEPKLAKKLSNILPTSASNRRTHPLPDPAPSQQIAAHLWKLIDKCIATTTTNTKRMRQTTKWNGYTTHINTFRKDCYATKERRRLCLRSRRTHTLCCLGNFQITTRLANSGFETKPCGSQLEMLWLNLRSQIWKQNICKTWTLKKCFPIGFAIPNDQKITCATFFFFGMGSYRESSDALNPPPLH